MTTEPPEPSLRDLMYRPLLNRYIGEPNTNTNNFELKLSHIELVQMNQFGGGTTEDPNAHLETFLEMCDAIRQNGVHPDTIKMRLFKFSLRDRAKDWYGRSLYEVESYTWEKLREKFLAKYFPPAKARRIIADIFRFSQVADELMFEAWERFRALLRRCPRQRRGISLEQEIIIFYSGSTHYTKSLLDGAARGGCLLSLDAEEAKRTIKEVSFDSYQRSTKRGRCRREATAETYSYPKYDYMLYDNDSNGKGIAQAHVVQQLEYYTDDACNLNQRNFHDNHQGFQGGDSSYHSNNRNDHYATMQPPPEFTVNSEIINEPPKMSLEETIQSLINQMNSFVTQMGQQNSIT